jgi:hypothetical protein
VTVEGDRIGVGWETLRARGGFGEGLGSPSVVLPVETAHGPLRLALGGQGEPRLLVPLGMHDREPEDFEGEALLVREERYSLEGRNLRFLVLECTDPALERVFAGLVEEVGRRIREGGAPVESLVAVVREFRHLLRAGSASVSRDTALGLVGELLVLERLVAQDSGGIATWQGPEGARHDFRCGGRALEVKTSLRTASRVVEISAIDQLFPPEGATLHLHHLTLEADPAGALSVPDLHGRIEARLAETGPFREKLEKVGFLPEAPGPWADYRFASLGGETYRVHSGFPRLGDDGTGSVPSVPAGVSAVRYNVDLALAEDFRLDDEAETALIEELARCP